MVGVFNFVSQRNISIAAGTILIHFYEDFRDHVRDHVRDHKDATNTPMDFL